MNKIKRGRGFRKLLEYLETNRDGPAPGRLIGGTMSGRSPRELAAEFKASRQLRPDIEKPVWHNALRMPIGEDISDERWGEIACRYMALMGYSVDKTQVCWWKHDDEAALHIVASRVQLDGTVYLGKNENLISTRVIQQLEREFGLTITKGPEYDPGTGKLTMPEARSVGKNEVEQAIRISQEPPRQRLQRLIDDAKADRPTALTFMQRLTAAGVGVRPNIASTGRLNGFSFELDGVAFKGSQLGDRYKWNRLQQEISYDQNRDRSELEKHRIGAQPKPTATAGENLAAADANLRAARGVAANSHGAARNLADRAARRAIGAYLSKTCGDRGEVAVDCAEVLSRRQAYKAAILEQHYQARLSIALAARLAYVQSGGDHVTITLRHGAGRIIDHGDRMTVTGREAVNDEAIHALIDLAKARGWKNIAPTGSREFRERLTVIATSEGLNVKPPETTKSAPMLRPAEDANQAEIIRQERERLLRARSTSHVKTHKPR